MSPHRHWSRWQRSVLLPALIAVLAVVVGHLGLLVPIEDGITSGKAELLDRKATGQVVIVEIDARSMAKLRSWPWPRRYHAQLLQRLHQSGAAIVAFDVDFSARSDHDAELASAIKSAGNVILPIFAQPASSDGARDARVLASRPDQEFRDAWVGGVNIFPDHDGVVREYPAALVIDGAIQPSIATLLAEDNRVGDRSFQPDWSIDTTTIPRFSFVDVMEGRIRAEQLRGKRVLIGATAIELGDRYTVPRYGVIPGVVVQALAAESLLQNRPMQRTGLLVAILGAFLIAFLLVARPLHRPAAYGARCASVLIAIIGGPIVAQQLWPVSVDSAAWLVVWVVALAVQLVAEGKRRLRERALFDADSGLPNRSSLEQAIPRDGGNPRVLVAAAIERFEVIRDGIGLAATNDVIRKAADQVATVTESQVHRLSPDVIAWVLTGCEEAAVDATVRRIQSLFREPIQSQAGPVDVAFTLGLDRDDGCSSPVLCVERALAAIGNARSKGVGADWYRNTNPQDRRQLSMMSDLRHAMNNGGLRVVYQPKMSLETGRITDAEALVRWHDESGRTISPDEFIPLAEATGVIREVTVFALRAALADLSRWGPSGVPLRLAVNVSALDLVTEDFAKQVGAILEDAAVPPRQLTLEVTESALIRSPAEAIATLVKLRDLGVRLSVDDYGTGQSTLSYLKHLPVHELKIDKSFVTTLAGNESDAIMVRSTINLAHELGLQVVAEGIEDRETLDMLRKLGCDYAQGFFISKPIEPDELFALISGQDERRRVA